MEEHFIKNVEFKNFKCFKELHVKNLKRVNLIGGKNNIGKTSFIEGCYLNTADSISLAFGNIIFARYEQHFFTKLLQDTKMEYIFNFIKEEAVKYKSSTINSNQRNIDFNYDEEELLKNSKNEKVQFLSSAKSSDSIFENFYADIQLNKQETVIDEYLNQFDSSIDSFRIIKSVPQISKKEDNKFYNINEFGEGMGKFLTFILGFHSLKDSYIFIDEIENGIHYTLFEKLWEIIFTISKEQNVQVFATTHSKECIEAFNRVNEEDEGIYLEFYKNQKNGLIIVKERDNEQLEYALSHNSEIRG